MPSVRDLKGRVIEEDAAPISRAATVSEPPAALSPEAQEAKRRIEQNKRMAAGFDPGRDLRSPLILPPMVLDLKPDPPLSTSRTGPVLPADLEAGLRTLEEAMNSLAATVLVQVDDMRAALAQVRAKAEADAEAMAKLDAVRKALDA